MRTNFCCAFALCVGLFVISLGQARSASLLPDLVFESSSITLETFTGSPPYMTQQIVSAGQQQLQNANSQVQSNVALKPAPTLSVSGSTNSGETLGGIELSYYVEFVGPTGTTVPVVVNAAGTVGGTATGAGGFIDDLASTFVVGGPGVSIAQILSPGIPGPGSFNFSQSTLFQANTPYNVQIQAAGGATVNISGGTASFFATIDPTFTIDPSFANGAQYSIELSSGVGNSVSATPLPSSFYMMLIALVSLGFMIRRQKSKPALTAA
jgi:hypothetical protein